MSDWEPYPRENCYLCGGSSNVLQAHHIVPQRHGGSDKPENLVNVCPTCHRKLEHLYSEDFYERLGLEGFEPSYKERASIEKIEDIDESHCEQFRQVGIKKIRELETANPKYVVENTNLTERQVSECVEKATAHRGPPVTSITGISEEDASELRIIGIKSVRDLATSDPAFVSDMTEITKERAEKLFEKARNKLK
jgi:predicted RecB family nuclease